MIAKLETGNGFSGALRYDVRAGKRGSDQELARVLDAKGVSLNFNDKGEMLIIPNRIGFDFRQQTMGYTGNGVIRRPVYHWVLSYHPDDKVSEVTMLADAEEFLNNVGFNDTQRVVTVHYNKMHTHLHIVTNVVDNYGKRISTVGLIEKAHAAAAKITKENGYIWGEKARKEVKDNAHKPHDRVRYMIEPIIRKAAEAATSWDEFRKTVEGKGVGCQITFAQDGKRGGISFSCEYEGQTHTFRGSSVGRQLSFGFIQKSIMANAAKAASSKSKMDRFKEYLSSQSKEDTKNIDDSNVKIEPYHDELLSDIRAALNELEKSGPSPLKNTHGNPTPKNKNEELWEKERAESEKARQEADIRGRRR